MYAALPLRPLHLKLNVFRTDVVLSKVRLEVVSADGGDNPVDVSSDLAIEAVTEDKELFDYLPEEAERQRQEAAAAASALTLEMVGDLPFNSPMSGHQKTFFSSEN
ncbi:hypothetical protein Clacol_001153 [Clathrus columnatus]|uniref:Uncharacterized protein n=1 Tax=Clathrus columnatus TaxID=1419009 RepID=A0AAV5A1S2_9AGAM|nr:hypothetical protein Clacol_001153 [Clathrus columnatus]